MKESAPMRSTALRHVPQRQLTRGILIAVGTIFLGLGLLGAFLPVLPTTPFLLLAAACYMRSSERLYGWMVDNPLVRPHLERFKQERSMTLRAKISVLALAWVMLMAAAIFMVESLFMKIFLVALAVIKTIVIVRIKIAEE